MKRLSLCSNLIIISLFMCSNMVHAVDQWRCTDESTTRSGNIWMACGTGDYMEEGKAREKALENALNEFKQMCEMSSDCKDRDVIVEPKRQTCLSYPYGFGIQWKCYKLVQITVK